MSKKIILTTFLFLTITLTLFSNNLILKLGTVITNSNEEIILENKAKTIITVKNFNEEAITDNNAKRVVYLYELINSIKNMEKPETINFFITIDGTIKSSIIFNSFKYSSKTYGKEYFPAGIIMILYDNYIEYSLHVITSDKRNPQKDGYISDNIVVININDKYKTDDEMLYRIAFAIEKPEEYIEENKNDMEESIKILKEDIERLKRLLVISNDSDIGVDNIESVENYINHILIIKRRMPNATVNDVIKELRKEKLPVKANIIYSVFRVYFNEQPVNNLKNIPN